MPGAVAAPMHPNPSIRTAPRPASDASQAGAASARPVAGTGGVRTGDSDTKLAPAPDGWGR